MRLHLGDETVAAKAVEIWTEDSLQYRFCLLLRLLLHLFEHVNFILHVLLMARLAGSMALGLIMVDDCWLSLLNWSLTAGKLIQLFYFYFQLLYGQRLLFHLPI